ncbi:KGGVGR-motif variant AAA ATPase [Sorangium sp. So ce131]|uniref:KGGVGR-motif variant AAA ATPase n=1 Tax=Sorangium sp. So ce131 TaxID=3133282 RepID=UPI003F6130C3
MRKRDRGQVITFYSFKGGVGRSMALANVAALFAQRGKKVLALDFDFEAPGLHRYFLTSEESSFSRYAPSGLQDGVIELFHALQERLQREYPNGEGFQEPAAQERVRAIIAELLGSPGYLYRVRLRNPNVKRAQLAEMHFMAAARFDEAYPERVRRFDWQAFYDAYAEVFPMLAVELGRRYDYVLIDSRTGVTDIGSICTMMLPDKLVLVFSPNEQSLRGVLEAGWQSVQERRVSADARPLPLFPLLSRVENSEESLKRHWVARARGAFERMFREAYKLDVCDLELYFNMVRIPHQSFYAYGEKIAVEEQATNETGSLAQAFEQFAECLDCESPEDAQDNLGGMGDAERVAVEQELLRKLKNERDLQEMILQNPDDPSLQLIYANFLAERNRLSEAVASYEGIVLRFGDVRDPDTQNVIAAAIVSKGIALGDLKRDEQELAAYDEAVARFGDASAFEQREQVGIALLNKGIQLGKLNRIEEELAAYDEVLRRFSDAPELSLRDTVSRALLNKGIQLSASSRLEEAMLAYDELLRRFSGASELLLREQVAKALVNKGGILNISDRAEEALAAYDEVLRRFSDAPELSLREQAATALVAKGYLLRAVDRTEEALATLDEVLRRFRNSPEIPLREQVATALVEKGDLLGAAGRTEEALATFDEVLRRFRDAPELSLREQVARALVMKGAQLSDVERGEEALAIYDEVRRRFGDTPEPSIRSQVARASFMRGAQLADLGRGEEALAAYDEVVRRFGDAPEATLLEPVARALLYKGVRLGASERGEEALAAYDEVVRRFGDAPGATLREQVARALLNKGAQLHALNRTDEGLTASLEIVHRFNDAKETSLRNLVAHAFSNIGLAQLRQAKQHWNDAEIARPLLEKAGASFSAVINRRPDAPFTLRNAGYVAFLLGDEERARTLLARAIQLGAERRRLAELKSADVHPLPQDEAFRDLIHALPGPAGDSTAPAHPSLESPESPASPESDADEPC